MSQYNATLTVEHEVNAESAEQAREDIAAAYGVSTDNPGISVEETEQDTDIEGPYVEIEFVPQEMVNQMIFNANAPSNTTWTVPLQDALADEDTLVKSDTTQSDGLKEHERAPLWVRQWSGPYAVKVGEPQNLPEGCETISDYTAKAT